jgi:hypothetical protein
MMVTRTSLLLAAAVGGLIGYIAWYDTSANKGDVWTRMPPAQFMLVPLREADIPKPVPAFTDRWP